MGIVYKGRLNNERGAKAPSGIVSQLTHAHPKYTEPEKTGNKKLNHLKSGEVRTIAEIACKMRIATLSEKRNVLRRRIWMPKKRI